MTSDTTSRCFELAADEVRALRARGQPACLALMVGDLAVPPGVRPPGGAWAIPPSYRLILDRHGITPAEVTVWGEAYCRNQGKRRLLDEARRRHPEPEATYARWGWALLRDGAGVCLASDASLGFEGDVRVAALTRGAAPLCPLVFAGLKRAIFQAGYAAHTAIYAPADDPWIDAKLRSAAACIAQLRLGAVGTQRHRLVLPTERVSEAAWTAEDLVAPGECPWPEFLAAVREHHPDIAELESPCPNPPIEPPPCTRTRGTSRSCG